MYVCGSTGEGFLLDTEERMLVAETVVNEVGKDMNIIVHVGCPMGDPRLPFLPVATDDPKLVELYHDIRKAVEDTKEW